MKILFFSSLALNLFSVAKCAYPTSYGANLLGSEEVPNEVMTDVTGESLFEYSDSGSIEFSLNISNPNGVEIFGHIGAHIHCGARGANGPIVVYLVGNESTNSTDISIGGNFTDADIVDATCGSTLPELVTSFRQGKAYVNVHSIDYPAGIVRGQITNLVVFWPMMSGESLVPPISTNVTGHTKLLASPSTNEITYSFDLMNPSNVDLFQPPSLGTGAHIHCGKAGENGPVVVFLDKAGGVLTDSDIVDPSCGSTIAELTGTMVAGGAYIAVHSTSHPSGEVRGNLGGTIDIEVPLKGSNLVPTVTTNVNGTAFMSVEDRGGVVNDIQYVVVLHDIGMKGLLGTAGAHIHCGMAGSNGPVVAYLAYPIPGGVNGSSYAFNGVLYADDIIDNTCGATLAELVSSLISGDAYVNVHSNVNPNGEVRGDIGADNMVLKANLSGNNEVPPVSSTVTGNVTFGYDGSMITFVLDISNPDGVTIFGAAGAHIHCGAPGTNGGITVYLAYPMDDSSTTIQVTGTITDSDIMDVCAANVTALWMTMMDGGTYVNVHSTSNPSGEVRANLGATTTQQPTPAPGSSGGVLMSSFVAFVPAVLAAAVVLM